MGGPDGGDGGRGAHIILKGNSNLWTLLHLRYFKNVLAENGEAGSGNNSSGRAGKDIIIEVPLGTIARDEETGKQEVGNTGRWTGSYLDTRWPGRFG
jgi:GTP-binding protein